MKKYLAVLTIAGIAMLAMVGCSKQEAQTPTPPSETSVSVEPTKPQSETVKETEQTVPVEVGEDLPDGEY